MTLVAPDRTADTSAPILEVLAERWSPRSYDETQEIGDATLTSLLEAARWSPSASNTQPWRFIVGRRGTAVFDTIHANLMGFNNAWAGSAAVLIVAVAETIDADGKERPWATYDLGQAVAHLSIQAHHEGLHVHQMAGIEVAALQEAFGLESRFVPVTVSAIGVVGDPEALGNEKLVEREIAPRQRLGLDEIVLVRE